ncbi:fungal-specific transcription factor domain protein, partial [Coniochaeta sp. 2T2.1]
RRYRSKKQRPCDVCRSRKIQCKLQGGNEVVCEMCKKLGRRCTYVLGPLTRKHHRGEGGGSANGELDLGSAFLGAQQDGGRAPELAQPQQGQSGNGEAHMAMEVDPFWMGADMQWSPRGSDALLGGMGWTTIQGSLGSTGLTPTDGSNHRLFMSPSSHGGAFMLNNIGSAADNGGRLESRSAPVAAVSSTGSPSTAPEGGSQASPQTADLAIGNVSSTSPHSNGFRRESFQTSWPDDFSLDSKRGYSHQLVGLSSECDPFFLRHYVYNEVDTYPMYRLHFRKTVDDATYPLHEDNGPRGPPHRPSAAAPVQFVLADEEIWKDDVKAAEGLFPGGSTEKSDMELLYKLVTPDLGSRLLRLYSRFVHPRYPVLSLSDLARMPGQDCDLSFPGGLRAAVYALATPFTFLDDELSVSKGYIEVCADDLWAIAHRSFLRASRISHLSSLQLCLLLLQQPPQSYVAADPPAWWALSCSALGLVESLGLNIDPINWRLPRLEIMLRRRLWWFTYSAHTWHALVTSRPSHLNDENWHVTNLAADDFEGDAHGDPDIRESIMQQVPICLAECELAMIAADVLKKFYTLRATSESLSLTALLARAQPLRARIESWRQTLPILSKPASELDAEEFEHGAALRLSHLTLEILIFRALLRPLFYQHGQQPPADNPREPVAAIFENGYTCAKVASDIVSSLQARHFASFWPPYVRYQLCYVSTFVLTNLAQSSTKEMAVRFISLLSKWRDTLRIQARAWPLARLAAMRLDAIYWKGVSTVVHGAGPDSPAVQLIKE